MKIAVLGAEGTGKSELARGLVQALKAREPAGPVNTADPLGFVVVDTPALMGAIYQELVCGDDSRYASALEQHRCFALTLVTGLDMVGNGMQHEAHLQRESVDTRLRQLLRENAVNYVVLYGCVADRIERALKTIDHHLGALAARPAIRNTPWQWPCEKCSDPTCEHRMFTGRLKIGNRPDG